MPQLITEAISITTQDSWAIYYNAHHLAADLSGYYRAPAVLAAEIAVSVAVGAAAATPHYPPPITRHRIRPA
jgi:hypothetical protein